MKRTLCMGMVLLSVGFSSGSGFCDSSLLKPGKSPTDPSVLPAATAQTEKAISQVMMDKLKCGR